jgi:site-specific DNA-methyltransferase (adenine-specific)
MSMKIETIGNATLYNGDCMEGMKGYPDGHFDLAVVDPPYGVGSITYMPAKRQKAPGGYLDEYNVVVATLDMAQRSNIKNKYLTDVIHSQCTKSTKRHFGEENVAPSPEYFKELFRVSKNQIIWGGNYFLLPPTRCFVVWRKPQFTENWSMAMAELAWTSFNRPAKVVDCAANGRPGERIHPTQKPVKVYEFLLTHFAEPGNKILDTHAGSASSLIASYTAGFEYVGFEIDEQYYDVAVKRIRKASAQPGLFDGAAVEKRVA